MTGETTNKTCPECGQPFQCPIKRGKPQRFCSRSCCLKVWHRERRAKFPEKVRAAEMANYLRHREKKMAKMREYHANHRDEMNAANREWHAANRVEQNARRLEHHYAHKDESNMKRSKNFQKERLVMPWKKLLRSAESRANKKKVPFALTTAWAVEKWSAQCALTGLDFMLGQRGSGPKGLSPSIDRIKPEVGYTPDNCRFVIWAVNAFKHDGDDELMYQIAEALLKHRLSN